MKKFGSRIIFFFSLAALSAFPWTDNVFKLVESGSESEIRRAIETDYSFKNHTRSSEKENLLMAALKNNRDNAIIDLILRQADLSPDSVTKNGVTAFMYACQYEDDIDVINNVLSYEAESNSKKEKRILHQDNNGLTSFDYARFNATKSKEILDLLSLYAHEPQKESESETDLEEEIPVPDEEPIPEESHVTEESLIPEENSVSIGEETVELQEQANVIEEAGTSSDVNSLLDLTALASPSVIPESIYLYDYASNNELSDMKIPESLIEAEEAERKIIEGANEKDSVGRTKLMFAAKKGDIPLIENLIYSGADINAKDNDGWTALMYAARFQKNADVTKLLLCKGSDCSLKNIYGLTALVLAAGFSDNPEVLSLLLDTYPADSEQARGALAYGISNLNKPYVLQAFIDRGVSLNIPYNGKTPLMIACQTNKNTQIIEWLLKNGASKKQIEDSTGKTAFDYAKENKKLPHNVIFWSLNPNS